MGHARLTSLDLPRLARGLARCWAVLLVGLAASARAEERTPTYWSLALGRAGATCTAIALRQAGLEAYFEKRYGTECEVAEKGDYLRFTCDDHVEAVLFSREACKDLEQVPMSGDERRRAAAFRVCMERSNGLFERDDSILYCDCVLGAAKDKMSDAEIAKAANACMQGLKLLSPPGGGAGPDGPVEAALRTACIAGVGIARGMLPPRADGDALQRQSYAACPTQLAKWRQQPGGYGKDKDVVAIACGFGIDAMFVGYGLAKETQQRPSIRVAHALERCVSDMAGQGITSDGLRDRAGIAPPLVPIAPPASYATCFAVSPDGLLVTARHVVDGRREIAVRFGRGAWTPARLVKTTPKSDVAVLRAAVKPKSFLSVVPASSASLGLNVFTVGYPAPEIMGDDLKFTEGTISSLSGAEGEPSFFQISVPIQAGNSGGPLVTLSGEVIGIIASTAGPAFFAERTGALPQNVNYALKSDPALPLLAAQPKQEPAKGREAAIQRAEQSVCAVRASP